MFQQVFGTGSLFGLLTQTKADKILEGLAEVALKLRRGVLWDEEENLHGVDVGVGWFSVGQLQRSDAERPDVSFVVVSRLFDDFRGHPEGSAYKGVLFGHCGRELTRDSKVSKLDLSIRAKEDVGGFDVSVQLVVVVQIFQTHEQLANDDDDVFLGDAAWPHEVAAAATRAVLHDDPQIRALEVGAIVLCRVGRVETGEDGDFLDDVVDFVFGVLDIDDFDGDGLAGAFVDTIEPSVAEKFHVWMRMQLTLCRPCRSCHLLLYPVSVVCRVLYACFNNQILTNAGLFCVQSLWVYGTSAAK